MNDLISRQAAINIVRGLDAGFVHFVEELPSAEPEQTCEYWDSESKFCALCRPSAEAMLCGYPVEHLALIATVLQKENLSPERVAEALMEIGRIVAMVMDEFEDTLRKAVGQCKI